MKQVKRPGEPQLELITVKRQTLNLSKHLGEINRRDADGAANLSQRPTTFRDLKKAQV